MLTSFSPKTAARIRRRSTGFTLIELLVVIAVIGILTAILIPTLRGIFVRTDDFQREVELDQLDGAIEKFKNDFGFIPPDFSTINSSLDMIPYLQKISPNNLESQEIDPIDGVDTRLQVWWDNVGVALKDAADTNVKGHETSLWFWLSQTYNSAQYPLTSARDPVDLTILLDERKVFFEFDQSRLHDIYENEPLKIFYYPDPSNMSDLNAPNSTPNRFYALHYEQAGGGEAPYIYFHHNSYGSVVYEVMDDGDSFGFVSPYRVPNVLLPPFKPAAPGANWQAYGAETYQIVAAGDDGIFGDITDANEDEVADFEDRAMAPYAYGRNIQYRSQGDNVTNFSRGRIETMEVFSGL